MAHLGLVCFPGRGHLDPTAALGRRLLARGHRVTLFQSRIAEAAVRAAGLTFWPIDDLEPVSPVSGDRTNRQPRAKWRQTVGAVKLHASRLLREGPAAIRNSGIDAAIVDQMDLAAGTAAEMAGVPFINLSCGIPVYLNENNPAPYFGWAPLAEPFNRWRNCLGDIALEYSLRPVIEMVNQARQRSGLREFRRLNEIFSPRGIVTQLPVALEFRRSRLGRNTFYTARFCDSHPRKQTSFPWDRLTARPLIYASMGTVRNNTQSVFQKILDACRPLDVQLVLSLGGGRVRPTDLTIPANAVVVHYAPQLELISRSALVVNCAGLNTTLDCVSSGIPMVAIPVAEDQPGIAARIREAKMGLTIPAGGLSTPRLRAAISTVLEDASYRESARRLQVEVQQIDGVELAARQIERALDLAPVFQTPCH